MKPKVLFICLGNSCRSIMAEALARQLYGEAIEAASAGIHPLGFIAPETLEVLAEAGAATAGLRSKGLAEVEPANYRLLVNLTHHSLAALIQPPLDERLLHRPVLDPYGGGLEVYRQSRDAIRRLISLEIAPRFLFP